MATPYNPSEIEPKWQAYWAEHKTFATPSLEKNESKAYILGMFPYPSGSGLHTGHLLVYTGGDVLARTSRKQGKKTLHPMGWDAFGLPAENFAIKSGVHPAISTDQNILNFKQQSIGVGMSYDWDKEINTSKPEYYRWTQWMFSFLYKHGLAYRKDGSVNWCPSCQTVLANEQVINGQCERCGTTVIQREMKQWYFRITDYAERLLEDLEALDWPERIKAMQRNWIGKSAGSKLWFTLKGRSERLEVFTTRPDTLAGATFLVIAPEHPLLPSLIETTQKEAVEEYVRTASESSELERTFLDRPKTGVFTGSYALNPLTKEEIPIWVADYVLSTYGTGAIMAVPAHDARDFEFAKKYELPIVPVLEMPEGATLPFLEKTTVTLPASVAGKSVEEAGNILTSLAGGEKTITYRLRDWLVSRQRYWGAPIPIAYDQEGAEYLIPEDQLPVKLPEDVEFRPTGQSPLQLAEKWKHITDSKTGKALTREVDTLDTFVCSSWYYLRYPNPHIEDQPFDPGAVEKWLPVDTYIGGAEHAVLHLLYARFITKALYDAELVSFSEPFTSLRNQGMILGPDHQKMSKSKGNVISPDEVAKEYGADALRVYELFMAPFDQEKPWNENGLVGTRRFLDRVWKLKEQVSVVEPTQSEKRVINRLVTKVTEDIAGCRFNTAIAAMMEALNALQAAPSVSMETYTIFLNVLNPFAPHITDELWAQCEQEGLCSMAAWPMAEEKYLIDSEAEYVVQINGKVRLKLTLNLDLTQEEVLAEVKKQPRIQELLKDQKVVREIVVPGKLVSLVVTH